MSAINDFNKVWLQKFPGSELPAAWEEDVKTNLAKHKKRVKDLREELKQEEVYVQFLESLLEEVEKRRPSSREDRVFKPDDHLDHDETLEPSQPQPPPPKNNGGIEESSQTEEFLEHSFLLDQTSLKSRRESTLTNNGGEGGGSKSDDEGVANDEIERPSSQEDGPGKDHFVTVIEVNGVDKVARDKGVRGGESSPSSRAEKPLKATPLPEKPKKVPPRPPPKNFKRLGVEPAPEEEPKSNSKASRAQQGRPVVFDSKKSSNSGQPLTTTTALSNGSGGKGGKRFEGSKCPLPPPTPRFEEQEKNSSRPSKILEMVNKMESSGKPILPSKNIETTASSSSSKSSAQRQLVPPQFRLRPQPEEISDYIDPHDAEFESLDSCGETSGDQIYDCPPVEDEDELFIGQEQVKKNGVEEKEVTVVAESLRLNNGGYSNLEEVVAGGGEEEEEENMYDLVAPDQEDQEDDYVMLQEDESRSNNNNNSNSSASNSNSKKKEIQFPPKASSSTGVEVPSTSSNKDSTIKSQTSIISGVSVATTSSGTSDTDAFTTSSPLPQDESKSCANYVNIDYFLNKGNRKGSKASASADSEDEEFSMLRAMSFDQYPDNSEASSSSPRGPPDRLNSESLESFDLDSASAFGGSVDSIASRKGGREMRPEETATINVEDQEKFAIFRTAVSNIADSESAYVEVLNVMLQYMKALKATLSTSKPVLSQDEFNIIFYKIPELFSLHQAFLQGIQQKGANASVGKNFENLSRETGVYGAFLQNYSRAVDTVRKCCQSNPEFAEITRCIRLRSMNKNQAVSLETLLYSPVSRVQKNVEIIQDLLKCLPENNPEQKSLKSALTEFQSFLTEFKMIQPEQFHGHDRPRHLVKNSFIVELSEGHRKLRHLFLFNDVLVCAKYKASGKDKFTFELKWYIPVVDCLINEESTEPREYTPVNLVALRSQASTVRDQIKRQTSREDPKKAKAEKQRKKLAELEAQLVLASPNLVFKVKHGNGKAYTFFLSSEYERSQWVDSIEALKTNQPTTTTSLSMSELQTWLTSCRNHLKTNMGSYLLRSGRDENLLVGDLYILIKNLKGVQRPADLYICLEVDSYGHFFRKAKTKMICENTQPAWDQDFVIELEGAQNIRILLYEDHPRSGTLLRAKATIELNRNWLTSAMSERKIDLQDFVLHLATKFVPSEMTIRRVPAAKPSGLFGAKITQVCKREKRQVPFIITSCVREVERRGINEVGIYRVSGSASDVSKLKKTFETNAYEAEQLLKEVDIHSVTGALKLYMRELPEALFTDEFYPKFFEAFNLPDPELKRKTLLQLFSNLPPINQHIILYLLDHMTRINQHENHNKMSLHNMATVFGPTLLRPGTKNEGQGSSDSLLAARTVDVMAQAGLLHFFLSRRATGEALPTLPETT